MKKVLSIILMALLVTAVFVSCDDPKHEHSYSQKHDETNHWKECSCGDRTEEAAHEFEWKQSLDKEKHYQECKVCGYKTDEIEHSFEYDHNTLFNSQHNGKCKDCGYTIIEDHKYKYIEIEEADKHQRECTLCGFKTDKVSHTYNVQKSDSENHWKACACGKEDSDNKASHTFGASTAKDGKVVQICTVCKYEKTVSEDSLVVNTENELTEAVKAEGVKTIKFADNIEIKTAIGVTKTLVLDLNNKVISLSGGGSIKMSGDAVTISVSNISSSQGAFTISGAEASISSTNGCVYYSKLSDAVAKAVQWNTITLLDNVELSEAVSVGKYITLDMNGKTLTYKDGGSITLNSGSINFKNVADGQSVLSITNAVAKIGDASKLDGAYFTTLSIAHQMVGYKVSGGALFVEGNTISLLADVELASTWQVFKQITLDLNNHSITGKDIKNSSSNICSVIKVYQVAGDLTIKGEGRIEAQTLTENEKKDGKGYYAISVEDASAKVTVEDGTIIGNDHAVYVYNGTAVIKGGYFKIKDSSSTGDKKYNYVLNCYNANYTATKASITVTGGSYENFNPYWNGTDTLKPGDDGNFVAEGYEVKSESKDSNTIYTVSPKTVV